VGAAALLKIPNIQGIQAKQLLIAWIYAHGYVFFLHNKPFFYASENDI